VKYEPVDNELISFGDDLPIKRDCSFNLDSKPFIFKESKSMEGEGKSSDEIQMGSKSIPSNEEYKLQITDGDTNSKEDAKGSDSRNKSNKEHN
jgi:hypothetical protein